MGTHRYAAPGQKADGARHLCAALELDHLRTGSHQSRCVMKRLFARFLIGAKRQVGHNESRLRATGHAFGVIDHVVHVHRQCRLMPLQHHA